MSAWFWTVAPSLVLPAVLVIIPVGVLGWLWGQIRALEREAERPEKVSRDDWDRVSQRAARDRAHLELIARTGRKL